MYALLAFLTATESSSTGRTARFMLEEVPGPDLPPLRRPDWLPKGWLPGGLPGR